MTQEIEFYDWLKQKKLSEKTIQDYLRYYDKLGNEFSKESVNTFLNTYNNRPARAMIQNLKRFLIYLYPKNEEIRFIEVPKITGTQSNRIIKVLSEREIIMLANGMPTPKYKLMILLGFYCGLRRKEILSLRPNSFGWQKWSENPILPGELYVIGKGDKERLVFVPSWLMDAIAKYNNLLIESLKDDDKFFNISESYFNRILKKTAKRVLGKHVHPHLLRHSHATWLLDKGMSVMELKELLGHSSIATTQIYLHLNKDKLKTKYSNLFVSPESQSAEDVARDIQS